MIDLDSVEAVWTEDRPEPIPGVVLWSMTCTGGAAYAQTLLKWSNASGLGLEPLCGKPESFLDEKPTKSLVYRCLKDHPAGKAFFTHVYPGNLQLSSDIPKAYDLLRLLKEQGASILLVVYRNNWLARLVSSVEVLFSRHAPTRVHGTAKRMQAFYEHFRAFTSDEPVSPEFLQKLADNARKAVKGDETGKSLGYEVIRSSYSSHDWPCHSLAEAFEAMKKHGIVARMPSPPCVSVRTKSNAPAQRMRLEERVGPQAAGLLRDNLRGTELEWMLDLDRENKLQNDMELPWSSDSKLIRHDQLRL